MPRREKRGGEAIRSNARSMNRCNSESHLERGADCIDLELDEDVRQSLMVAQSTKAILYYLSQSEKWQHDVHHTGWHRQILSHDGSWQHSKQHL